MDFKRLNDKQIEAIKHIDGPCLVLAGAGSGKTSVLTNRIAYLIENGVCPSNILAITFTNKAAKEMRDRVYKLIGKMAYETQISTFHSFGLKLLKENYKELGYLSNFTILDSDDTLTLIKKILKENNMDPKFYNPRVVRNKISGAKNELMMPDEYAKYEYDEKIIDVYKKYLKRLKNSNSVDFDDLLLLPIKLFKERGDILDKYQEKYKYVLIDEYQDTNEAQYVFTKMITDKYKNIFVVGDESQAIYGFRNANYKNILNFEKDYKNTKTILLEQNYRSTQNILDCANSLIKHNKERKDKRLWCDNQVGNKIKYLRVDDEKEEALYVADKIKQLVANGVSYEDICVLYRTNAQSRVVEEEMLKKAIPYRVVGSFYFYNREEIKDLICYLRLIHNSNDDISLLRVINKPRRGIGTKTIEELTKKARDNNISIYEAISSGRELLFKGLIEEMKILSENMSLTEIVEMVLDKSSLRKVLEEEKDVISEVKIEYLEEFKSITKSYEEEIGVVSLEEFLNELSLVSDVSLHTDSNNKVSLMTIHAVKGLEFDNVFVMGLEEGIFPHFNSINEGNVEEERRLMYVAITRAKKDLWLLNAKSRMLFGQKQNNLVSRFIDEIDQSYLDIEKRSLKEKIGKIIKKDMYSDEEVLYEVGDLVKHKDYGEGVVVSIQGSLISVAFAHPFGVKKIMKNHKHISKL